MSQLQPHHSSHIRSSQSFIVSAVSFLYFTFQLDFEDEPPDEEESQSEEEDDGPESEEDHFEDAMEKLSLTPEED